MALQERLSLRPATGKNRRWGRIRREISPTAHHTLLVDNVFTLTTDCYSYFNHSWANFKILAFTVSLSRKFNWSSLSRKGATADRCPSCLALSMTPAVPVIRKFCKEDIANHQIRHYVDPLLIPPPSNQIWKLHNERVPSEN